ncbi:hypothetical protein [Aeromicrobium sp.]|uniref:hypothetical protein n=1 Tax=Aeromicrobium sp. TaxID=1871063 RepID=UPI0030C27597
MSSSAEDIYTYGLDMLTAAVDATDMNAAIEAVRVLASDLGADDLRRVATMLAVESIWTSRPRRSRRAVREWIQLRRFGVLARAVGESDV